MSELRKDDLAFITGSAGGLGKEFARRLLKSGLRVCLSDINLNLGQESLKEFQETFGKHKVHFELCDVTKMESFRSALERASGHFGGKKVDVLVNNAGVMGEREGWKLCLDINLTGVCHGCTLAQELMARDAEEKCAIVINVSSVLGLFCGKQPKGWAYNTSKSAVVTLTRCMGTAETERTSNLRMMALCPSVASTPILDACTEEEIEDMDRQVGGIMSAEQVGEAFEKLVFDHSINTGDVMAVWKDSPPYIIPDTSFGVFLFFTIIAMTLGKCGFGSVVTRKMASLVAILITALIIGQLWAFSALAKYVLADFIQF